MLNDIVLHCFVGVSLAYCCLNKKWKSFALFRAALAWAVVASLLYFEIPAHNENLYSLLAISKKASKAEIVSAFRQLSKTYHPDRNRGKHGAEELFIRLKKAHEILSNATTRSSYNRFGDFKEENIDDKTSIMVIALSIAKYAICFVVAYFCTFPKSIRLARQIALLYIIGGFCLEIQFRFSEEDDILGLIPYFNDLLPFEKANLFFSIFPTVLTLAVIYSHYIYVDVDEINVFLMKGVLNSNRVLCERLSEVVRYAGYFKSFGNSNRLKMAADQMNSDFSSIKLSQISVAHKIPSEGYSENGSVGIVDETTATEANELKYIQKGKQQQKSTLKSEQTWKDFTESLTDEQKEQLSKIINATDKSKYSITWSQIFFWTALVLFWLYYK